MKTLVVGLGNPILGDDGVGWVVAEQVRNKLPLGVPVDVDCVSLGGISLMERLIGYERVVLVDAFISDQEQGSIVVAKLEELPNVSAFHLTNVHDVSLQNAMEMGRQLGADLPEDVTVVGVSASHVYDFSEELSPPIKEAVPKMTAIVVDLLTQNITIH